MNNIINFPDNTKDETFKLFNEFLSCLDNMSYRSSVDASLNIIAFTLAKMLKENLIDDPMKEISELINNGSFRESIYFHLKQMNEESNND